MQEFQQAWNWPASLRWDNSIQAPVDDHGTLPQLHRRGEEAIWSTRAEPTYCADGQGPPSIPEQLSSSALVPGPPPETARNAARTTLHGNLTSLPSLTRSAVNGNLQRRAAHPLRR
jgi:hypothetical protein